MARRFSALLSIALAACGSNASTGSDSGMDSGDALDMSTAPELPCDIADLLATYCLGCHANPTVATAPMTLLTRADLLAPAPTDHSVTVAEKCVLRMQDMVSPMPPSPLPAPTAGEVGALMAWIAAGSPAGTCDEMPAVMSNPYDTPTVCTTDTQWTMGNVADPLMRPGTACIACHSLNDAPEFDVSGTVYDTAHEPDDCQGTDGDLDSLEIVITDAMGAEFRLPVNGSGNFYHATADGPIQMPYTAKVVSPDGERLMAPAQLTGECNACHSETGAEDAPGRIMRP